MENNTRLPLTVYGLLAKKWNTSEIYVGKVARGDRKAQRGKGLQIKQDIERIKNSLEDWYCHTLNDGALRFEMPDNKSVYIQHNIASVYKGGELLYEKDVKGMTLAGLTKWLNVVRVDSEQ